jgi:hypothetical protein
MERNGYGETNEGTRDGMRINKERYERGRQEYINK